MKKKYLPALITVFLAVSLSQSQNPITNTDSYLPIVPQTPNTASLLKYEETPVSKNSGLPQIGLPIQNISVDGINIPVSLNYNSSGIRVNEVAPWTGHGWNLMAGGSITRTVRHLPDDNQYGYMWVPITTQMIENACLPIPNNDCIVYTNYKIRDYTLDFEPDIFTYNVPGTSGKFMFNQVRDINNYGEIKSFPISNNKIIPVFNAQKNIISWTIYDTRGNKFEFGIGDRLSQAEGFTLESVGNLPQKYPIETLNPNNSSYTQTWNLTRITTYKGNIVNFSYYEDSTNDYVQCSFSGQSRVVPDEMNNVKTTYMETMGTYTELEKIDGAFGSIIFNKGAQRIDYPQGRALSEILVKDPEDVLKKKFTFKYSYTEADNYPSEVIFGCGGDWEYPYLYDPRYPERYDPYMNHMFLDEVDIFDDKQNPNKAQKYIFNYYDEYKLPHRNSYAQDFWGYYNGANNNTFLFDYTARYTNTPYRHAEPEYAVTGLLKTMHYPTGGHTKFTYEGNWATTTCGNAFGFRLIPSDEKVLNFNSRDDDYEVSNFIDFDLPNSCNQIYTFSKPLILNKRTFQFNTELINGTYQRVARFEFGIEYSTSNGDPICIIGENAYPEWGKCSLWMTVRKTDLDPDLFDEESQIDMSNLTFDPNFDLFKNCINTGKIKGNSFPMGVYVFDFHIANSEYNPQGPLFDIVNDMASFNVTIRKAKEEVKFYDDYREVEIPIGGMRIKKIEDFTSENTIAKRREFNYVENDSIKTSGRVLSTPYFISGDYSGIVESSLSAVPLITTNAGNVNYRRVSEDVVDYNSSTKKLSTVSTFRFYPIYTPIYKNPMIPFMEDWRYGQEDSTVIPSKKIIARGFRDKFLEINYQDLSTYHYAILPPTTSLPYTFTIEENISAWEFVNNGGQYRGEDFYDLQYGHLVESSESTKTYIDDNPDNYIEQSTAYNYDNDAYTQPTSIETEVNNGKKIKQKFYYPYDLIGVEPFAQTLLSNNRFSAPMIEESYMVENGQERLLSKSKTTYSAGSGKILPNSILSAKGNNNLETRVIFNDYDSHGNPIDVSILGGAHTSYIWSYGGQHLVAKIENLSHAQLPSQLVAEIEGANNETVLFGYLQQLRNHQTVQNAQITTFTYKPLVGITTITDPKGYTMNYIYDDFGRFRYVKDMDGNVLSENQYHYITD